MLIVARFCLWSAPRGSDKWLPLSRPCKSLLSRKTQGHAVRILKSPYKFLVHQCYLFGNDGGAFSACDA
jgi:hypothetical protein